MHSDPTFCVSLLPNNSGKKRKMLERDKFFILQVLTTFVTCESIPASVYTLTAQKWRWNFSDKEKQSRRYFSHLIWMIHSVHSSTYSCMSVLHYLHTYDKGSPVQPILHIVRKTSTPSFTFHLRPTYSVFVLSFFPLWLPSVTLDLTSSLKTSIITSLELPLFGCIYPNALWTTIPDPPSISPCVCGFLFTQTLQFLSFCPSLGYS